ncbi:MAG TPA: hypothetical protein DD473_02870 [Planctomycetaceae bacterium]|nr:hypothetical protein [Planctomycetaceae bacterium]
MCSKRESFSNTDAHIKGNATGHAIAFIHNDGVHSAKRLDQFRDEISPSLKPQTSTTAMYDSLSSAQRCVNWSKNCKTLT